MMLATPAELSEATNSNMVEGSILRRLISRPPVGQTKPQGITSLLSWIPTEGFHSHHTLKIGAMRATKDDDRAWQDA
jgi:hypothetical protein